MYYWSVKKKPLVLKGPFNMTLYNNSYVLMSSEVYNKEEKPGQRKVLINIYSRTKLIRELQKKDGRKCYKIQKYYGIPWRTV